MHTSQLPVRTYRSSDDNESFQEMMAARMRQSPWLLIAYRMANCSSTCEKRSGSSRSTHADAGSSLSQAHAATLAGVKSGIRTVMSVKTEPSRLSTSADVPKSKNGDGAMRKNSVSSADLTQAQGAAPFAASY